MTDTFTPLAQRGTLEPDATVLNRQYPCWLCDIWGVVHNGITASPSACDALKRHRDNGGIVILITNAPRPSRVIVPQLDHLGADDACYDAIVSSGDVTRHLVSQFKDGKVFHLGPEKDLALLDGLPVNFVGEDEADVLLCSGLLDDRSEQPEDYDNQLTRLVQRGLVMICANPDKVVRYGNRLLPCAGALAERYQTMGGEVKMAGKPYAPIYRQALALAAQKAGREFQRREVLAIGDGLATDLRGAADFGVDCLFVLNGIHESELAQMGLEAFMDRLAQAAPDIRLAGITPELTWSKAAKGAE